MSFDEAIALDRVGDRRYACDVSPDYWIVADPNGGYSRLAGHGLVEEDGEI